MFYKKNTQKGFTLVELLVVIAIIGILSSVVLASLNTARAKGRDAKRVSDLNQIRVALELFFNDQPAASYPASLNELAGTAGYLPVVPEGPTGDLYLYSVPGIAAPFLAYHLRIALEEGANAALRSDADCSSAGGVPPCNGFSGAGSGDQIDGTDPVYDLVP